MKHDSCIVIPNWNGLEVIEACLDSLLEQSHASHIIVVDNGSTDGSRELIEKKYPQVEVIALPKNRGFAGGVNAGIKRSMELGAKYTALFNDDAIADKDWLKHMVVHAEKNNETGIVTCKFLNEAGTQLDSTGDFYTTWGLPFPRGRGEKDINKYDEQTEIFGATGGASLYRNKMLEKIGLFDEDFFAYYEDVDISFRAQLAGWKVVYEPSAEARHKIGHTSGKIKGFTTYQTMKNLPWLFWKNVPRGLMLKVLFRLKLAYFMFWIRAASRGHFWPATKGFFAMLRKWPKKMGERKQIQNNRRVSVEYINSVVTHDLPANAAKLRSFRSKWWKLTGRHV